MGHEAEVQVSGENIPSLENPSDIFLFEGFQRLSISRPDPQTPIPMSEILAYCNLIEMPSEERFLFIDVVQSLDMTYLKWYSEKQNRKLKEQERRASRGNSRSLRNQR